MPGAAPRRWALRVLGLFECLLGCFVLFWPGAWQEAVHPLAMGTVFYPLQAMAAGWLLRGGLTVAAARSASARGLARGAWILEIPFSAVFLIRAGLLGPWAAVIHGGRLVLTLVVLALLRSSSGDR